MAIQIRHRVKADTNMSSMSDLVFLLLIFFMLTSTLVSPNAVKLLLPSSNSKTMAKPAAITVYIDEKLNYYVEDKQVDLLTLNRSLEERLTGQTDASVVVRADKTVDIQYLVNVIDAVNDINEKYDAGNKVILATSPNRNK